MAPPAAVALLTSRTSASSGAFTSRSASSDSSAEGSTTSDEGSSLLDLEQQKREKAGAGREMMLELDDEPLIDDFNFPTPRAALQYLPFQSTCGAGVIVAFIRLHDPRFSHLMSRTGMLMGVVAACSIQAVSIAVQVLLTFLLYAFPVEQAQDPFEVDLLKHRFALEEAVYSWPPKRLNDSIPEEKSALDLCFSDHTVPFSQSLLIFVWVVRTVPVVSTRLWNIHVIRHLPIVEVGQALADMRHGQGLEIRRMTCISWWVALLCVQLPEVVLTLSITYVGVKFLLFSPDLVTLIITSMGMFFLMQVDSVIFEGITSHMAREQVKNSTFCWRSRPSRSRGHFELWGSSLLRAALAIAAVLTYTRLVYRDLQLFRGVCMDYKERFPRVECDNCGLWFFGMHLYPP